MEDQIKSLSVNQSCYRMAFSWKSVLASILSSQAYWFAISSF